MDVLGETLPLAAGIALSPFPLIAVILVLLSPRGRPNGIAFAAGWQVGLLVLVGTIVAIGDATELAGSGGAESTAAGIAKLAIGLALAVIAVRKWRHRPRGGAEPPMPGWMRAFETAGTGRAFVLSLALSFNPKNLAFALAASTTIGASAASAAEHLVTAAAFAVLAASPVVVQVVAFLVAGRRLRPALVPAKDWLLQHSAAVMGTILIVFAANLIGDAIAILA